MGRTISFFAGVFIGIAPAAIAAETLSFRPVAAWQHQSHDDRCRATRVFGEGDEKHVLVIEQFQPDDHVSLTLAGPAFGRFTDGTRARLEIAGHAAPRWVTSVAGSVPGVGTGLAVARVPIANPQDASPQSEATARQSPGSVTFRQRGRAVRLEAATMGKVFATLNACSEALAMRRGIDVARLREAVDGPKWVNEDAIRGAIANAFKENWRHYAKPQAIGQVQVIVNETGRAEQCAVVGITSDLAPNERACAIMQQARFEPASDAGGRPIRAPYTVMFRDYRHVRADGIVIGAE